VQPVFQQRKEIYGYAVNISIILFINFSTTDFKDISNAGANLLKWTVFTQHTNNSCKSPTG